MSLRYTPENILITGGAGFIGSHLCRYLVENYPAYTITCLDSLEPCASLKNIGTLLGTAGARFTLVHGSIENAELLRHVFQAHRIDTVLHCAAQSHVDRSFANSVQFTKTNVLGTHILLEAARVADVKRFIHVSTDEVYGETVGESSVLEEQLPNPTNPYACSKAAAELIAKSYKSLFNMPIIITRSNNVYGPCQYPEKVMPKFIIRLLRNEKCCLHGDGSSRRAYLHVDDLCTAFDAILHDGTAGDVYNCGSPFETSILDLAKLLIRKIKQCSEGDESAWIEFVDDRKTNDKRYAINSARLIGLGWRPKISIDEGIVRTIDWYREAVTGAADAYWQSYEIALAPHPLEIYLSKGV